LNGLEGLKHLISEIIEEMVSFFLRNLNDQNIVFSLNLPINEVSHDQYLLIVCIRDVNDLILLIIILIRDDVRPLIQREFRKCTIVDVIDCITVVRIIEDFSISLIH